jgi:hypothetical protein
MWLRIYVGVLVVSYTCFFLKWWLDSRHEKKLHEEYLNAIGDAGSVGSTLRGS